MTKKYKAAFKSVAGYAAAGSAYREAIEKMSADIRDTIDEQIMEEILGPYEFLRIDDRQGITNEGPHTVEYRRGGYKVSLTFMQHGTNLRSREIMRTNVRREAITAHMQVLRWFLQDSPPAYMIRS